MKVYAFLSDSQLVLMYVSIAALAGIIGGGHQEQRRGIGGSIKVGRGFPIDALGGLRVFVHNFAVGPLAVNQKVERAFGECIIAIAVNGVGTPQGVAAEKPSVSGPRGIGGFVIAGHHTGFALGGFNLRLINGDFSPAQSFVYARVGSFGDKR